MIGTVRPSRLAVLAVSSLVGLGLAELALRHLRPLDTGSSPEFRVPHPTLGWVPQPGTEYVRHYPDARVHVRYNSGGWRDTEHDLAPSEGAMRLVVLGDSYMEGYSVNLEETFTKRLEALAGAAGLDLEVVNLGVGGYGTLQEYLLFREVGRRYAPDLVLLAFHPNNDVRNNSLSLESAVTSGIRVTSRPFLDPEASLWRIVRVDYDGARERYLRARQAQSTPAESWKRRSALYRTLDDALNRLGGRSDGAHPPTDPEERAAYVEALLGHSYCVEPPGYTEGWEITRRILGRLAEEVAEVGAEMLIFTVPAIRETDPEVMETLERWVPAGTPLCLEEAPAYDRLEEMVRELGIPYLDLLPAFRSAVAEGLYRHGDGHWNETGHRLAAELVLTALIDRGLVSPTATGRDASSLPLGHPIP